MRRRRFLRVLAGGLLAGGSAAPRPLVWRGVALGAATTILLDGADGPRARAALAAAHAAVAAVEAAASLHRPDSALSRLNATGRLATPSPMLDALLAQARAVHAATDGFFDPTVQPLWRALAVGADPDRMAAARRAVGLDRVADRLPHGMALTFNGMAQGLAADRVADVLRAHGYRGALVDMGEFAGFGRRPDGRPWRIGAADRTVTLEGEAAATSAPGATRVGPDGAPHILDPVGAPGPRWAQVTVIARRAALADALSTAIAAAPMGEGARLLRAGGGDRAILTAADGTVRALDA